jgi:hypothetical protein
MAQEVLEKIGAIRPSLLAGDKAASSDAVWTETCFY